MIRLKNRLITLRRAKPRICLVLIGPPQFSITLEHREDKEIGWTTALCILWFAIFIDWGWLGITPVSWSREDG